jgi:hypothetical protein
MKKKEDSRFFDKGFLCACAAIFQEKLIAKDDLLWFLEHNGFATVKDIEKTAPDEFELELFRGLLQ